VSYAVDTFQRKVEKSSWLQTFPKHVLNSFAVDIDVMDCEGIKLPHARPPSNRGERSAKTPHGGRSREVSTTDARRI